MTAVKVEIKNASSTIASGTFGGDRFEIYGTVSGWTSAANTFTVTALNAAGATYTALASSATISGTIGNTSVIEAKGYLDSNRNFVVTKLEVKASGFTDD